ncbi:MAG: bifunctional adenosylcobinamide kinase/adenosylcobinamide-phosphate guanylyltransferase [Clostridia bacterium]|nr:bifunctional adenosylcobinamide kinase/adenosylcobinamide-phosphate guanylyltransferase [Clostridia bacterium]
MLILVTGGSKCGKSGIAEKIISSYSLRKFYIATMIPFGEEAFEAIERHREIRRNEHFETIEKYTDIHEIDIPKNSAVLLECMGNLCANEMFESRADNPTSKILSGVLNIAGRAEVFVIVTNQVGEDGIKYPTETMNYIKNMGWINRKISEKADCVIEAVYGIPVALKGELPKCLL